MPLWIGAPGDARTGDEAKAAIANDNDTRYYHKSDGIIKVDEVRWRQAQKYELEGWARHWTPGTDRNAEHAALFNNYAVVPSALGHVCEIGCGPFTQLQTIAQHRTINHVTLIDPLITTYKQMKECPYRSGKFRNHQTTIINYRAELLKTKQAFDTIICINVLEHVMDAMAVLENIHHALKDNGVLIFGERHWDDFNPLELYDIGHPIRVQSHTLKEFRAKFVLLYQHNDYFIGTK